MPATDGFPAVSPCPPPARPHRPITPLYCHSHPESANALFSTLRVRVQAEGGGPAGTGAHLWCRMPEGPAPLLGTGPSRVYSRPRHIRDATGRLQPGYFHKRLDRADCLSLRSAVALRDLEFDPLALFEGAVAIRLDS